MMTSPSVDGAAEVRAALREILREYGAAGLDDAKLVAQLLPDLLAASPREAKLILAATSAGVAGILRTRQAQGMTLPGAMRDAAVMLAQDSMIEAGICDWIVTEFASALGYPTTPTSMPETTSGPPAPVRSDPTTIDRPPMPPTRVAPPPPRYAPPYGSAPRYPPPVAYPSRPSYQMMPPPVVFRPVPPPRRRSGGTTAIIVIAVLLLVGVCGGTVWYVGEQARKASTKTFAQCLGGDWSATTAKGSVTMTDGTVVPTALTGGALTRYFYTSSSSTSVNWSQATFTGTYKGKPVVVVYDGSTFMPYTTSGDGDSAVLHLPARSVAMTAKVTVLGKTTTYSSIDLPAADSHATCTDTTLTIYDSGQTVHSTWAKRS
jgi:hypothetical protein